MKDKKEKERKKKKARAKEQAKSKSKKKGKKKEAEVEHEEPTVLVSKGKGRNQREIRSEARSPKELLNRLSHAMRPGRAKPIVNDNPFLIRVRRKNKFIIRERSREEVEYDTALFTDVDAAEMIQQTVANYIELSEDDKESFLKKMETKAQEIEKFLVEDIALLQSAVSMALPNAQERLSLLLDQEIQLDSAPTQRNIKRMVEVSIIKRLCGLFEFDPAVTQELMLSAIPTRGTNVNPQMQDILSRLLKASGRKG